MVFVARRDLVDFYRDHCCHGSRVLRNLDGRISQTSQTGTDKSQKSGEIRNNSKGTDSRDLKSNSSENHNSRDLLMPPRSPRHNTVSSGSRNISSSSRVSSNLAVVPLNVPLKIIPG